MKVTTVSTVYVGKGAKAKAMEPGTGFDTKKVGMDDEEALGLIAAGHLAVPAVEETKPNEATAGGGTGGLDSEDPAGAPQTPDGTP